MHEMDAATRNIKIPYTSISSHVLRTCFLLASFHENSAEARLIHLFFFFLTFHGGNMNHVVAYCLLASLSKYYRDYWVL